MKVRQILFGTILSISILSTNVYASETTDDITIDTTNIYNN